MSTSLNNTIFYVTFTACLIQYWRQVALEGLRGHIGSIISKLIKEQTTTSQNEDFNIRIMILG